MTYPSTGQELSQPVLWRAARPGAPAAAPSPSNVRRASWRRPPAWQPAPPRCGLLLLSLRVGWLGRRLRTTPPRRGCCCSRCVPDGSAGGSARLLPGAACCYSRCMSDDSAGSSTRFLPGAACCCSRWVPDGSAGCSARLLPGAASPDSTPSDELRHEPDRCLLGTRSPTTTLHTCSMECLQRDVWERQGC